MFETLDDVQLESIHGGAEDTMGPTVLVAGRPQTRQALFARRDALFAHADDPKMSNEQFLRTWKKLNDAYQRLPSH